MDVLLVIKSNCNDKVLYKKYFEVDKIEEDKNDITARWKNQNIAFFFSKKVLEKKIENTFYLKVDSIDTSGFMVGLINGNKGLSGLKGIINVR